MTDWNFADVWEAIAREQPDAPAVVQGDRVVSWSAFERRADAQARALAATGLAPGAKVAQLLYNAPEYLESLFACFKGSFVPVNTNYRYKDEELRTLWAAADVSAVVFHGSFTRVVEAVRPRLPGITGWIHVDDDGTECPDWAVPLPDAVAAPAAAAAAAAGAPRSGDDLVLIYTGGTTGRPKGVMWRQDDLFCVLNRTAEVRYPEDGTPADVAPALRASKHPAARLVPGAPLMHAAASFTSMSVLDSGGCIVLLEGRRFDASELLDLVERERVTEISLVGDPFVRPILAELRRSFERRDLSSLWLVISSGAMWSSETKAELLALLPGITCVDTLGASESVGMASSVSTRKGTAETAGFRVRPGTRVIDAAGTPLAPGTGEVGRIAIPGRGPIGYYQDPEASARTFPVIDGVRCAVPGDFATIDSDGEIRFLGRGSGCINTGGEKVFPEEVEEVLKRHDAVEDAVVVGVADDRFGEVVVAVVEPTAGAEPDVTELVAFVRLHLADYKAPKWIGVVPGLERAANGKVDVRRWREYAASAVDPAP